MPYLKFPRPEKAKYGICRASTLYVQILHKYKALPKLLHDYSNNIHCTIIEVLLY